MNRVPRLLELVRALLFGTPESSHATRGTVPDAGHNLPTHRPSPEMWGAVLAGARRRRAPRLWPPELPAVEDDFVTRALVRAYVLPPAQCARLLTPSAGEAR